MRTILRLSSVLSLAIILLGLFFTGLAGATPGGVQSPPLHYKSRLGLMPAAYTAPTHNSSLRLRASASLRFLSPYITVTVGSWPQVLTLADFTGDALNDVALATDNNFDPQNDEHLHLFAGQAGDLVSRTQRLPAGSGPEAITAEDFNADGQPDVALALSGENAVLVYTQTAGVGLNAPITLSLLGEPNAVAAGDFSGDLRDDLAAIAPLSGTIAVWRGWGGEGGETPAPTVLPYPTGGYDALAAGDLDNDGDDDLVALRGAGYLTESIVIYWQDAGYFPISTTLTPETGGYLPHSLTVGDVNGDGLDDIVVTAGGNAPDAFLNAFLQGAGGLTTTPFTYPAYHLPSAVAIGDVDHDGLNDVVVTHDAWQTLSVYTQTVGGTLSAYATAPIPYSDRYRPAALGLADLDGNGGLDVALVDRDHGLTILTNTLTAPTAVIMSPTHTTVLPPGPITVTGSASGSAMTVEVRLKGDTDWMTATLNGATWETALILPAAERAWWIEARAIDAQGCIQAPVDGVRIGVEDGPPRGTIIINGGAYATNQATVTLTLPTYDVGGVTAMRFTPDGQFFSEWLSYTLTHTWTFATGDGMKTLQAQFRDINDNLSSLVADSIILDTLPPTSTVTTLPLTLTQTTLDLHWSGEDTGSGIALYDVQMRESGTGKWNFLLQHTILTQTQLGLQVGHTYCFRSRATDRANNEEAWPEGTGDTCTTVPLPTYGVTLTPDADNAIGNPGQTVTYTLRVHNTGNSPDTYTVTLDAHAWEATPAEMTLGPVAADATATLKVYVTIPPAAQEGDSEVMIVQVTSHGDGESNDTAQLTTWATLQLIQRGARLTPATALKVAAPGASVTYTLLVENTGNVPDDYMLSIAGATWPTAVTPPTLRWLAAGATARVIVSVTIPVDALAGAADTAQVTVVSQDENSVQATATLQTVAYTTAITRGLEMAPATQNGTGTASAVVTYTVTITNTGNVTDTVILATTANDWPTQVVPASAILPAAAPLTVMISVTIPTTATVGIMDNTKLIVWGTEATISSELTTTVLESTSYIYLPLVLRQ